MTTGCPSFSVYLFCSLSPMFNIIQCVFLTLYKKKKGKRKFCEQKTYQLMYRTTFLFEDCVIREATRSYAGKTSCPKSLIFLQPLPALQPKSTLETAPPICTLSFCL